MLTLDIPRTGQVHGATDHVARSTARGRQAAFLVVGFLAGFLPLNTYWALGGTWGIGWVLGCADCTPSAPRTCSATTPPRPGCCSPPWP